MLIMDTLCWSWETDGQGLLSIFKSINPRNIWPPAQSVIRTSGMRILVPKIRKEMGNI